MRRADLRQPLTDLIAQLEHGCGYEHCVIRPHPRKAWRDSANMPRQCTCTPPDIALRLRTLARAIKGYRWEDDKK